MKKKICLLLAALLLMSMAPLASANAAEGEPLSISITTVDFGTSPIGKPIQVEWENKMSEMLGRPLEIKYEFINVGDYADKIKLILSSGDLPDILTVGWLPHQDLLKYGAQGLFAELTSNWDKLPNYKNVYDADPFAPDRLLSNDGNLYGFYNAQYMPDGSSSLAIGSAVRKDILDELGIPVPLTLDDFYEAAKAIKAAYPDLYPIIQHEEWEPADAMALYANKVAHDTRNQNGRFYNGEEYVYSPITEEYREALRYMNKLYTEELISPDYFTHTQENGIAAIANGTAMMIPNLWNGYVSDKEWLKDYPDQEWVLIPVVLKDAEQTDPWTFDMGHPTEWQLNSGYSRVINASSPNVDALLSILDYEYSEEIIDLLTWGIEGVSYEVVDGNRKFLDKYMTGEARTDEIALGSGSCRAGIFPEVQNKSIENIVLGHTMTISLPDGTIIHQKELEYSKENITPETTVPFWSSEPKFTISTDDAAEYANVMTPVETLAVEWKAQFIKGDKSLDDDWDAYLSEMDAMGDIQYALDIYNAYLQQE